MDETRTISIFGRASPPLFLSILDGRWRRLFFWINDKIHRRRAKSSIALDLIIHPITILPRRIYPYREGERPPACVTLSKCPRLISSHLLVSSPPLSLDCSDFTISWNRETLPRGKSGTDTRRYAQSSRVIKAASKTGNLCVVYHTFIFTLR